MTILIYCAIIKIMKEVDNMYQEWMDGVPLLFKGAYYNNINELERAINYYEMQGDYSTNETYKEM